MIKRVLKERQEKAAREKFEIRLAENIHGFHKIKTEEGRTYEITIRDFAEGSGYCSCPDFRTNKLGTCKHLIFASDYLNKKYKNSKALTNQVYPFVEIYCDPHYDYNITYFYERNPQPEVDTLIHKYFLRQSRDVSKDSFGGFPNGSQYVMPERYSFTSGRIKIDLYSSASSMNFKNSEYLSGMTYWLPLGNPPKESFVTSRLCRRKYL